MGVGGSVNFTNKSYTSSAKSTIDNSEDQRYPLTSEGKQVSLPDDTREEFLNAVTEILKYYVYKEENND